MFIGYEEKSDKLHSYKLLYKLNSSLSLSERNQLVYSDHIISLCIFQQKTNFQKLRGFFEHANLPDTMDVLFRFLMKSWIRANLREIKVWLSWNEIQ